MAKKRKQNDPLATLLETAPKAKLVDLLVCVAGTRPDVRRECLDHLDYLNRYTALSPSRKKQSEGEKLLALWDDLSLDLDAYGGGDYDVDIHVSSLIRHNEYQFSLGKNKQFWRILVEVLAPK